MNNSNSDLNTKKEKEKEKEKPKKTRAKKKSEMNRDDIIMKKIKKIRDIKKKDLQKTLEEYIKNGFENFIKKKEYDYLEMIVVFYNEVGSIIEKSSLVWNMNNVPKDQSIKVTGSAFITGEDSPAKAEVFLIDDNSETDLDKAVYNETIEM